MAHKTLDGNVQVFDITTFLWHARCFAVLIRPFLMLTRGTVVVASWKFPKVTLAVWLFVNLLTTVIPTEYSLAIFLIFLSTCVALGVLHHYTQIFIKLFPDGELENSALQAYLQRSWGDEQKILEEYRRVLYKIDGLLVSLNASLETFYNILKWEKPLISCCWALAIGTLSIMLYLTDLRLVVFVTNNAFLLGSGWYLHVKRNRQHQIKQQMSKNEANISGGDIDCTVTQIEEFHDQGKHDPNMDNDESDVEESDMIEADDQETSQLIDASTKLAKETGTDRPNMVKKLMDLRKRHHQANAGLCSGCQASFMSILKKKYFCCNCGNQFCSRCCYLKVPKSFLGVTAPATKNDTVLVCAACHRHLLAKNNG